MAQYVSTYPATLDTFATDTDYINHIIALQQAVQSLEKQIGMIQRPAVAGATPSVVIDASQGSTAYLTMPSGNTTTTLTISNPINGLAGQMLHIVIDNTGPSGTCTYSFGSAFIGNLPTALTVATGKRTNFTYVYDGTNWHMVGQTGSAADTAGNVSY